MFAGRAAAFAVLALAVAPASASDDYALIPHGGAEGGPALVLPNGDILNVRNVQGGTVTDPNLDLGAGSSTHRGTLSLNYDVGRCVVIYDGHKRPLARFCPHRIHFYVRVR